MWWLRAKNVHTFDSIQIGKQAMLAVIVTYEKNITESYFATKNNKNNK